MKRQSLQLCALILIALTTISLKSYSQYWKLKGNAGTKPATNFVGTTDSKPLLFRTNNVEAMRISAGGNVGIGVTVAPVSKLQVKGGTTVSLSGGGNIVSGDIASYNIAMDGYNVQARYNGSYTSLYLNNYGGTVYAGNTASSSYGLVGYGVSYGLYGYASSSTGTGVYGTSYYGVYGTGTYGVYGRGTSYGGYFYNASGIGVYGYDAGSGHGVYGYETGSGEGVDGYAYGSSGWGVYGYSSQSIGVYGYTANSSSYAGYFSGNVYCTGTYLGSDQKLKQNINDFSSAMDIIKQLHPKQYQYRQDGNYKSMNLPQGQHYGLIAQDVEKILPNLVKDSKFDVMKQVEIKVPDPASTEKNPKPAISKTIMEKSGETVDYKALNYTELIPLLIKGMQEQQQQIDALKQQVATLTGSDASSVKTTTLSSAGLLQNVPNPYKNSTTIQYNLPAKFSSAQIIVTDNAGKILKQVNVSGVGKGSVNINASSLAAGNYNYSLWIDGRLIETRQMVLAK
jgi:endosialidase-like protein